MDEVEYIPQPLSRVGIKEEFVPIRHSPPDSLINWLKFNLRLAADFQVRTVYQDLNAFLPQIQGPVLDVGCGESPYRNLIEGKGLGYVGTDYSNSGEFGYERSDIIRFSGNRIPFYDELYDTILCTEVLEHTPEPEALVQEAHRILKKGGRALFTVPWSARTHYMPNDYCRFTPTKLAELFQGFSSVDIHPRGTDITTICAKIMVAEIRAISALTQIRPEWPLLFVGALVGLPIAFTSLVVGRLSLRFNLGSETDPLGYTIVVQK